MKAAFAKAMECPPCNEVGSLSAVFYRNKDLRHEDSKSAFERDPRCVSPRRGGSGRIDGRISIAQKPSCVVQKSKRLSDQDQRDPPRSFPFEPNEFPDVAPVARGAHPLVLRAGVRLRGRAETPSAKVGTSLLMPATRSRAAARRHKMPVGSRSRPPRPLHRLTDCLKLRGSSPIRGTASDAASHASRGRPPPPIRRSCICTQTNGSSTGSTNPISSREVEDPWATRSLSERVRGASRALPVAWHVDGRDASGHYGREGSADPDGHRFTIPANDSSTAIGSLGLSLYRSLRFPLTVNARKGECCFRGLSAWNASSRCRSASMCAISSVASIPRYRVGYRRNLVRSALKERDRTDQVAILEMVVRAQTWMSPWRKSRRSPCSCFQTSSRTSWASKKYLSLKRRIASWIGSSPGEVSVIERRREGGRINLSARGRASSGSRRRCISRVP